MSYSLTKLNAQLSSSWSFHLLADTNNDISYALDILGNKVEFGCFSCWAGGFAFSDVMLIETNENYFFQLETFGEI